MNILLKYNLYYLIMTLHFLIFDSCLIVSRIKRNTRGFQSEVKLRIGPSRVGVLPLAVSGSIK